MNSILIHPKLHICFSLYTVQRDLVVTICVLFQTNPFENANMAIKEEKLNDILTSSRTSKTHCDARGRKFKNWQHFNFKFYLFFLTLSALEQSSKFKQHFMKGCFWAFSKHSKIFKFILFQFQASPIFNL